MFRSISMDELSLCTAAISFIHSSDRGNVYLLQMREFIQTHLQSVLAHHSLPQDVSVESIQAVQYECVHPIVGAALSGIKLT